jgi:hypothetical protein
MAQNPNINFTSANSIINVNGTIVKAINVNDPTKYAAGQPVDPNSNDPLIKGLNYRIDGGPNGTGKVTYSKNGVEYDSLNSYAQSPTVRFGGGYTANTTKVIQTAMQKNVATAISTSLPTQPSAQNPNPGGNTGTGLPDLIKALTNVLTPGLPGIENLDFSSTNEEQLFSDKALLKYPRDILDMKQDTLQITMYNYQAPLGDTFLPKGGIIDNGKIFTNGLQRNSALKKFIGTVVLPIPSGIQDNNAISWGDDTMNSMNAGVAGYMINQSGQGIMGQTATGALSTVASAAGVTISPQIANQFLTLLAAGGITAGNPLLKPAVVSALLKNAGYEVSAETILARGAGIVPNSNLELLFQGPTLRSFGFSWRMSPRSELEARNVKRIIRFFKQGSSPRKVNSQSGAGARSLFLGTPNVFKLSYKTGNEEISGLNKFKICALVNMSVVYAPDGTWAAYDKGQPVSLTMSLSFNEIEPVYEDDYRTDNRMSNTKLKDNPKVYPDDVGY